MKVVINVLLLAKERGKIRKAGDKCFCCSQRGVKFTKVVINVLLLANGGVKFTTPDERSLQGARGGGKTFPQRFYAGPHD